MVLTECVSAAAIRGCQLEQMATEVTDKFSHEAMDLSEQLGDLYCKVGCYNKALEAYQAQVRCSTIPPKTIFNILHPYF